MGVDIGEGLKQFMRRFPQGVTIVTTSFAGQLWGLTVSSFTSISISPPLILIAISKDAFSHDALVNAEGFSVQLLAAEHAWLSERFASKSDYMQRFAGLDYFTDKTGAPIITGIPAYMECRRWRVYEGGDHSLVLGEVVNVRILREAPPLVYHNRRYTTITDTSTRR